MRVNGFDCDGVITVGICPGARDIVITGRSFEEESETIQMLNNRNIKNMVFFNSLPFDQKTRYSSGEHKAKTIRLLKTMGIEVVNFFEDDEIQKEVIERECPEVNVIHCVHNLTNKENVRHLDEM